MLFAVGTYTSFGGPAGRGKVQLHGTAARLGHGFDAFQVDVRAGERAAYVGAIGQLAALLPVKQEGNLLYRIKFAQRLGHGLHHQPLLLGVLTVQRFLG